MKYSVTYRFQAQYTAEVEADSPDEAKLKAEEQYINANFGEASDIDGEPVVIEDELGNRIGER